MHSFMPPFSESGKSGTSWNYRKNIDCYQKFQKSIKTINTNWLESVVVIDQNGKKVGIADAGGSYEDTVYVPAKKRAFAVVFYDSGYDSGREPGLLVHAECYKKVKKLSAKGENLFTTYKDFIPVRERDDAKHMIKAFGVKRTRHWGQDPCFYENGRYLLTKSELKKCNDFSAKVYQRISKMREKRKAPIQSATEYKVGFKSLGIDNSEYKVVKSKTTKKWQKVSV
jgi:hypothetical protein